MNQKRNTGRSSDGASFGKRDGKSRPKPTSPSGGFNRKKSYGKPKSESDRSPDGPPRKKTYGNTGEGATPERPFKKTFGSTKPESGSSSDRPKSGSYSDKFSKKSNDKPGTSSARPEAGADRRKPAGRPFTKGKFSSKPREDENPDAIQGIRSTVRLNKYLADAGICSRREADRLIQSGVVEINGVIVTELGTKVGPEDKVHYGGELLKREKLQYVLLNKPKGFISTSDDPLDRKTVMNLVENACKERIYSVGRLDRNTTGVLLFTNDGDMAKKLTHPKHGVRKLYHVTLDKPISKNDLLQIMVGFELEDGFIKPDKIDFVEGVSAKNEVGIELHSGKNRIVRRIFEHLDYHVEKLDRVVFAGLTKKDVPRGKFRILSEKEVMMLKML